MSRSGFPSPLLLACLASVVLAGCSILEPNFLAESSDVEGGEPTEVEVSFSGNGSLGSVTLREAVRPTMMILSRGQAPEASAYDGADAIAERYRSDGFPDVEVEWLVEGPTPRPDLPDLVAVRYSIAEGPRVTATEMTVESDAINSSELLPLWERRLSGALGLGAPLFDMQNIRAFADSIAAYYRQQGYLEVSVEPGVARDAELDTAAISMKVFEGQQFRFGSVALDPRLLAALGNEQPDLPDGEVFTTGRIRELLLDLQGRLRRLGYPDPIVQIPPFPSLSSAVIDLEVQGDPGRVATVGEVRITGAEKTRESFIRGKLSLEAGDRYDGAAVDEGIADLYRTGVFKRVQIRHEWIDDESVVLTIEVEEMETRFVEVLAGYGSYEQLRGGVSFGERNLFGTGKRFTVDGKVSQKGYRAAATLSDPDLFGSDITGSIELEAYRREMPSYTDRASGGTAAISRVLAPGLTGRFGYTYLPRNGSSTDVVGPGGADVDFTQGSLFFIVRYDDRDSVLSPTRGWSGFVGVEGFDPALGADVSFLRLRAGGTHYIPISDQLRLALRAEAGWIWPGESPVDVPIQERFFNGGESTVRSFRQDQLGPKDSAGNPVGGEYWNVLSVELRVPVYRAVEAALFVDAGNVGLFVQDYGLSDLSYALGTGLRLALPIGPLRVDAGWNPDPGPEDRDWTVLFSVGYPF